MAIDFSSITNWITARNNGVPPIHNVASLYAINLLGEDFNGKKIGARVHAIGFNMANATVREGFHNFLNRK